MSTQKDLPKPERNKPCACNSGRKFKKCCGDPVKISEKRIADHAIFMEKLKARAAEREKEDAERRAKGQPVTRFRPNASLGLFAMSMALASMPYSGRRL